MKFFKKYRFNKSGLVFSILIIIVSIICFIVSSYNISSTQDDNNIFYKVIRDIAIVVSSTFGVNLLLGLCITKHDKNKAFEEFFHDEIILSPKFYEKLDPEEKMRMLQGLELEFYYNGNSTLRDMCKASREKIISVKEKYYYDNCEYTVKVSDQGSYFEKDIVHNISVMSYTEKATLSNFRIASITNNTIAGMKVCEITGVTLNGVDVFKHCKPKETIMHNSSNGQIQEKETALYYNKKLHLSCSKPQNFVIHLTTRCPKDDITSSFRASVPCRSFCVDYTMEHSEIPSCKKYELVTHTFGCCEHANDFSTAKYPNNAKIKFTNLILKDDGVVVVMCEK